MNKNLIYVGVTVALILTAIFTGCKKEENAVNSDTAQQSQVDLMADEADKAYKSDNYTGGDESNAFYIDNDGLPEAYTLEASDMDESGQKRGHGSSKSFIKCLRKLNLTDTQVMDIKQAMSDFETCKFADIRAHRDSIFALLMRTDSSRKALIKDFRDSVINYAQLKQGMKDLRTDFAIAMRAIKLSHAQSLKACYAAYLTQMQTILTPRQWNAFLKCRR